MKRANGTGCITKLSGNRRNPYMARVTTGFIDGAQQYRTVGYYPTEPAAVKALRVELIDPLSGNANITLAELFLEYKKTRGYKELSKQTQDNYTAAFMHMAKLHKSKFGSLKKSHMQSVIDEAEERGKTNTLIRKVREKANCKNKRYKLTPAEIKVKIKELEKSPEGVSLSSLEKIKALFSILSEFALSEDIVRKTYYKEIYLPPSSGQDTPVTFNDFEIKTLFNNDQDDIVKSILILIYTGMRIEELLSLSKFYVNIKEWLITGGVKTEAGKDRVIPIHHKIQDYVKYFYDKSKQYLLEWEKPVGNEKKGTNRVVLAPYTYEYYRDLYDPALQNLKIRYLTPHKARHTFFTLFDGNCDDDWAMAVVGGHTDPNFSKKKYSHPDIERLRKAVECIP